MQRLMKVVWFAMAASVTFVRAANADLTRRADGAAASAVRIPIPAIRCTGPMDRTGGPVSGERLPIAVGAITDKRNLRQHRAGGGPYSVSAVGVAWAIPSSGACRGTSVSHNRACERSDPQQQGRGSARLRLNDTTSRKFAPIWLKRWYCMLIG